MSIATCVSYFKPCLICWFLFKYVGDLFSTLCLELCRVCWLQRIHCLECIHCVHCTYYLQCIQCVHSLHIKKCIRCILCTHCEQSWSLPERAFCEGPPGQGPAITCKTHHQDQGFRILDTSIYDHRHMYI